MSFSAPTLAPVVFTFPRTTLVDRVRCLVCWRRRPAAAFKADPAAGDCAIGTRDVGALRPAVGRGTGTRRVRAWEPGREPARDGRAFVLPAVTLPRLRAIPRPAPGPPVAATAAFASAAFRAAPSFAALFAAAASRSATVGDKGRFSSSRAFAKTLKSIPSIAKYPSRYDIGPDFQFTGGVCFRSIVLDGRGWARLARLFPSAELRRPRMQNFQKSTRPASTACSVDAVRRRCCGTQNGTKISPTRAASVKNEHRGATTKNTMTGDLAQKMYEQSLYIARSSARRHFYMYTRCKDTNLRLREHSGKNVGTISAILRESW